jgi:SM-20-related protein
MNNPNSIYETIIDQLIANQYAETDFLLPSNLLTQLRDILLLNLANGNFKTAGTGNKTNLNINEAVRNDKILWIDNNNDAFDHIASPEKDYFLAVQAFYNYLNETCYTGIQSGEFHYAVYEPGSFYKKHIDRFKNDDSRKFTFITYLNPDWLPSYGGQLAIYLPKQTTPVYMNPNFGKTVIFKSHILAHEVLPATRQRLSITGWLK